MNILLIRTKPHKDTINLQSFMICEPLELEILAAVLENEGHNVTILDFLIEKKKLSHCLNNIDMVCFTAYLVHVNGVKKYASVIKSINKKIITVVGGIHAEVVPSDFLDENIDFIVARKPLETIKTLAKNGQISSNIEDCVYSEGKTLCKITVDLNPPLPMRHKTEKYRKHYNYVLHSSCATIKTSFGCPFQCEFCFCREITDGQYLCKNLDIVAKELVSIKENNVFIVDDNFLQSKKRVEEFCQMLDKHKIQKNFIVFGRADFINDNESSIKLLKEHGLKSVFVGIESFKNEELNNVDKRTTVEMNIGAIKILEKYEIESYMGLICHHDWEKKDFDHLIKYLSLFKYPFINLQPITPIPGTGLFEIEKDKIELKREKYHLWDMAHLSVTPTKISIRKFYKNILRVYFKTSASRRVRKYIRKEYGMKVYYRTLKGACSITYQYLKLIIKGKINL